MRPIFTVYTHTTSLDHESIDPDPEPGSYFVTMKPADMEGFSTLQPKARIQLGPFKSHRRALLWVDAVSEYASDHFNCAGYVFGTIRANDGGYLGELNKALPDAAKDMAWTKSTTSRHSSSRKP